MEDEYLHLHLPGIICFRSALLRGSDVLCRQPLTGHIQHTQEESTHSLERWSGEHAASKTVYRRHGSSQLQRRRRRLVPAAPLTSRAGHRCRCRWCVRPAQRGSEACARASGRAGRPCCGDTGDGWAAGGSAACCRRQLRTPWQQHRRRPVFTTPATPSCPPTCSSAPCRSPSTRGWPGRAGRSRCTLGLAAGPRSCGAPQTGSAG